jgi:hypothetical protein
MKKRIFATFMIIGIMATGAIASTITATKSVTPTTLYDTTYKGSGSTFRIDSRNDDSKGTVCESYVKNTASYTEYITVGVKEYNDSANTTTYSASNHGNIISGAGIGCAPILRSSGTNNYHYIHTGTVLNYKTRATVDTYKITVDQ